jgi:hypothetical protein
MQSQSKSDKAKIDLEAGRQARIALRQARIEQTRSAKLKSTDTIEGNIKQPFNY